MALVEFKKACFLFSFSRLVYFEEGSNKINQKITTSARAPTHPRPDPRLDIASITGAAAICHLPTYHLHSKAHTKKRPN